VWKSGRVTKNRDARAGSRLSLQFLAAWLAVWLRRVLQQEVGYLTAENPLPGLGHEAKTAIWSHVLVR
jgi:hypothetical protein